METQMVPIEPFNMVTFRPLEPAFSGFQGNNVIVLLGIKTAQQENEQPF